MTGDTYRTPAWISFRPTLVDLYGTSTESLVPPGGIEPPASPVLDCHASSETPSAGEIHRRIQGRHLLEHHHLLRHSTECVQCDTTWGWKADLDRSGAAPSWPPASPRTDEPSRQRPPGRANSASYVPIARVHGILPHGLHVLVAGGRPAPPALGAETRRNSTANEAELNSERGGTQQRTRRNSTANEAELNLGRERRSRCGSGSRWGSLRGTAGGRPRRSSTSARA
jgi:hypothetical protein